MFNKMKFQKDDKVVIAPKYQKKYKTVSGISVVTGITWDISGNRRLYICKFPNGRSECFYSYELEKANNSEKSAEVKDINTDYNSKTNTLKITPPKGYVVDEEKSTFTNVVFKPKSLTYDDVAEKLFHMKLFYATTERGDIMQYGLSCSSECLDVNNATSKYQLECILAKNRLANVALYLNDGWKPGENNFATYLSLNDEGNIVCYRGHYLSNGQVIFKTNELAQQAIEILGEDTIKLALEPLGI